MLFDREFKNDILNRCLNILDLYNSNHMIQKYLCE